MTESCPTGNRSMPPDRQSDRYGQSAARTWSLAIWTRSLSEDTTGTIVGFHDVKGPRSGSTGALALPLKRYQAGLRDDDVTVVDQLLDRIGVGIAEQVDALQRYQVGCRRA